MKTQMNKYKLQRVLLFLRFLITDFGNDRLQKHHFHFHRCLSVRRVEPVEPFIGGNLEKGYYV